jgi:iron(III) transport system substrate-binding protein
MKIGSHPWLVATSGCAVLATLLAACSSGSTSSAPHTSSQKNIVNWYTTVSATDVQPIIAAFLKAYPNYKVNPLRLSADQIPARVLTEQRGGKYIADVISCDSPEMAQLIHAGALAPYTPPGGAPLPSGLSLPSGYTGVIYEVTTVPAWNPAAVKKAHLTPPTSWQVLAEPEWKGKFSMDPGAVNWYESLVVSMGHSKALALLQALGRNKPVLVTSHTQAVTQVEAGQPLATATAYGYLAANAEKKDPGLITFANPDPLPASLNLIDIAKNAPHLAAAKVFVDWLVSKAGQTAIVSLTHQISLFNNVGNDPAIWDPSKWPPVWGPPVVSASQYNQDTQEMDKALGVP